MVEFFWRHLNRKSVMRQFISLFLLLFLGLSGYSAKPADLAPKWWQDKQHDDAEIAGRKIDWNQCATGIRNVGRDSGNLGLKTVLQGSWSPVPDALRVGALIHAGSSQTLRDEFWEGALDSHTQGPGPGNEGLLVSVVPYVVQKGQRHYLVPLLSGNKFEAFVLTCTPEAFDAFGEFPHYYSSVLLRILGSETGRRARLHELLDDGPGARFEFLDEPVSLNSPDLPDTLGDLLRPVFRRKEADFLARYVPFKTQVKPIGIGGGYKFQTIPQANMRVLLDPGTPAVDALWDLLASRPTAWRVLCDGTPGSSKMPVADPDQRGRFSVPCSPSKQAKLEIKNFDPIRTVAGGALFRLGGDNLIARLAVKQGQDYGPRISFKEWPTKCPDTTSISIWKVPFRFFETDGSLHLPLRRRDSDTPPEPCPPILTVQLAGIIEGEHFPIEKGCIAAEVRWPPAWGIPVRGCEPYTIDPDQGRCLIRPDKAATLVWPGLIGTAEIQAEEAVAGKTIELKGRLRPRLPFPPRDPWLGEPIGTGEPCADTPAYQPVRLSFFGGDGAPISHPWTGGSLHGLAEIGWPTDRSLPRRIELRLEQQKPENPAFKTNLRIGWNPVTDRIRSLKAWAGNKIRRSYSVVLKTPPSIEFDDALEVHWYSTQDACTSGTRSPGSWDYAPDAFTNHYKDLCGWARLMRGSERISHCTRPDLNRTRDQLVLDFRPLSCGADRRLILIALSKAFDPIGNALKDDLRERLIQMKQAGSDVPFNLLSIGEGQRLNRVLACEGLAEDGEAAIRAAIAPLRFRSENLEALGNLSLVTLDPEFAANRLRSVLYLTDGSGLEEIDDRKDIPARITAASRAPILDWRNEEVDFRVLTTDRCATWQAMDVPCEELPEKRRNRLDLIIRRIDQHLN
ncbi:MAG: hypothetical protein LGR52_01175 [Candidatus Thiosymbion ectosymbiont of Robbea hypermnestra]|nr:hypothetical protein [Candidatus Thiosymbion ectosymbiont of Robbea hypermnestra]